MLNPKIPSAAVPTQRDQHISISIAVLGGGAGGLTIHRSAGLVNQAVAFDDAVGEGGLAPGHIDRGGGQLAEVDEAGSTGSWDTERE